MSWQASRWAAGLTNGSLAAKSVLWTLAEAADAKGYTFLGHDELARRAEISKRAVVMQMALLEEAGFIRRDRRPGAERRLHL